MDGTGDTIVGERRQLQGGGVENVIALLEHRFIEYCGFDADGGAGEIGNAGDAYLHGVTGTHIGDA